MKKYRQSISSNSAYEGYRSMLDGIKALMVLFSIALILAGLFNGIPTMKNSFQEGLNMIITQVIYALFAYAFGDLIKGVGNVLADIADATLEFNSRDIKE